MKYIYIITNTHITVSFFLNNCTLSNINVFFYFNTF